MCFEVSEGRTVESDLTYAFVCVICASNVEAEGRAGKLLRDRGFLQINLMAVRLISAHIEAVLLPFEERLVRAARADVSGTAALFRQSGHLSGA
ncbi:hypothetical protein DBR33_10715 [Stenotrophomonas sp. HMWF022]|nr:hypothetical protein DBR20_02960 [Stenotrophomonas sp. HMWF023]PTT43116.1 hypothetical protein DBR33_10715 [Stenotrophomonas sp. HMWF022]